MKVTFDFETRSHIDLRKLGVYRYASDPSTEILCVAVKIDSAPAYILEDHRELEDIVMAADTVHAHNMGFERNIYRYILVPKYGMRDLPLAKLRCSAAACAAAALPRDLDGACRALNLPILKDNEGHKLMMQMCKPNKRTGIYPWSEEKQARLEAYCITDVEAEYCLEEVVPPLSKFEQQVWIMDQVINDRGYLVDLDAIRLICDAMEKNEKELLDEIETLTGGQITSTRQVDKTKAFLYDQGLELDNLQKGTVAKILKTLPDGAAKRVLEIRTQLAKASTAKFHAMEKMACVDGRVRGGFVYSAASTRRWAGKGVQPHNLPRESFSEAEFEDFIYKLRKGDQIPEKLFTEASKALRTVIYEPAGMFGGDFSAIEGRVLAWEADEQWVIDAYNKGDDMYKHAANAIYDVPYDEVTKDQRQIGKVAELALGFQGWTGAFQAMAVGYGVHVDEEKAAEICGAWRNRRPKTKQYWYDLNDAAVETVQTGHVTQVGKIKFGIKNNFLLMGLPSGGVLRYYDPQIRMIKDKYDREKPTVTFMGLKQIKRPGMSSTTKLWTRLATYGGKLAENATQGIARDFLTEAMMRLDLFGYDTVLHVHDEVNAKKFGTLEEFKQLLTIRPVWAQDCPVDATAWSGVRYHKE